MITVGSDFSGVGAFNQALNRLNIEYDEVFACDMDKYARQTFIANYGEPKYYPTDVYEREIPKESLDIFMTSPPCQAFSLAGNRKGEEDKRGVLFYNSHEFIKTNKPRFFIFENVKGLLSSKSCITYKNSLYLLLYNFKNIDKWESLELQKNNLTLLSQSITNYLCLNYANKLSLKKVSSGMYYTTNSELGYEKLEKIVKSGLKRRLKFLNERIYQITKNSNFYPQELTVPLECKEEDLVLNQDQLYLIESLKPMVTSLLEKTVDINANTSLFVNNILEENSKQGRLFTTLTEINSTMTSQTFMYALEMNIIRLITLALDLSLNLWKEIWLILIGKKEFIGLKTFDIWLFNLDHLNYKVHHQVLNAKHYGIPQNRERIFIVGIRDDEDNRFQFPTEIPLTKRLKDVLEDSVDEKYYLSDKMVSFFVRHTEKHQAKGNGFKFKPKENESIAQAVTTKAGTRPDDNYIKVKSATSNGYETAKIGEDSINLEHPNSKTRRGRVGKQVGQTLTTSCNQGVAIAAIRGRNNSENKIEQTLEVNKSGLCNSLTTVQKDNVVVESKAELIKVGSLYESDADAGRVYSPDGISCTLKAQGGGGGAKTGLYEVENYRIRKLTPIECFRLMDFPDSLVENARKVNMSDSMLYKQAGNSIAVGVLERILKPIVNILNEKN